MRDVCQLLSKNSHCSDQEDETHHLIVLDVVALTTGAVLAVGLIVGPPVDVLRKPEGSSLDGVFQKSQAL